MYYNLNIRMNTPKYNGVNPRNAMSPSPVRSSAKGRYFSPQEVNKMLKTLVQPKIQFLMEEIEQKQQIIAQLNSKLNENDQKLKQQTFLIQSHIKKQRDLGHIQSYIVGTINQLINDKTKQSWETIGAQLKQIAIKAKAQLDPKNVESKVQMEIQKVKSTVSEFIDSHKKKSNNYWQKIKEALCKINQKISATEKDILDIKVQLQNFQQERSRDRQTISQLQNSKHVVKNMIQLKLSVDNIYQNYQSILNLQKSLKQRLEDQHGESLWHQPDFLKSSTKLILGGQEVIALQYSREEAMADKGVFQVWKPSENTTQPIVSPTKERPQDKESSDFHLQKTSPLKGQETSQVFSSLNNSNQMNSKIYNSAFLLNHSLQARKEMCNDVRQRLNQLIQLKNLRKPLEVRLDQQINCLKTAGGNYLFDAKGNMFKLKMKELVRLQQEGLIIRYNPKTQLCQPKIRRTLPEMI